MASEKEFAELQAQVDQMKAVLLASVPQFASAWVEPDFEENSVFYLDLSPGDFVFVRPHWKEVAHFDTEDPNVAVIVFTDQTAIPVTKSVRIRVRKGT